MARRPGPCRGYLMPLLRVLGCLVGLSLLGLGVWELVQGSRELDDIVDNSYRCIFAVLIVLAELRLRGMLVWFSFLTYFAGLGAFYIFVGGLAMGSEWYEVTIAIVMVSMGFIYLLSACACSELAHQHQEDASERVSAGGRGDSGEAQQQRDVDRAIKELESGDSRKAKLIDHSNPWGSSDDMPQTAAYAQANAYSATHGAYGNSNQDDDSNPFGGSSSRSAYS